VICCVFVVVLADVLFNSCSCRLFNHHLKHFTEAIIYRSLAEKSLLRVVLCTLNVGELHSTVAVCNLGLCR
jgi:hypothetical protein